MATPAGETLSGSGSSLESGSPLGGRPKHVRLCASPQVVSAGPPRSAVTSVEEAIHTSGCSRGVGASKSAEAKALPEKSETTQSLEILLKNIVALAYDSLHAELKASFLVDRTNASEFGVRFHEYDSAQTSTMYAATHARGGSNSLLWVSEWGYIQATDLRRSEEILTGAIPSAKNGTIVVETTWRGGRGGHLWEIVKKALETPEEQKQPDDWRVVFFPWQNDQEYMDSEPEALTAETIR